MENNKQYESTLNGKIILTLKDGVKHHIEDVISINFDNDTLYINSYIYPTFDTCTYPIKIKDIKKIEVI